MNGEHRSQREQHRNREQDCGRRDIAQVTVGKTDTAPIQLQLCHSRATEGCGVAVMGLDVLYDHGAPGQR
jgi:hypothetical protein